MKCGENDIELDMQPSRHTVLALCHKEQASRESISTLVCDTGTCIRFFSSVIDVLMGLADLDLFLHTGFKLIIISFYSISILKSQVLTAAVFHEN